MARFLAIDADAHGLLVVVAAARGGSVKIERALAAVEDARPLGPASAKALGARLKDLLRDAGVAPAPALVCVGRDRVILKEVRYPPTAPADEPAVVRFQATKDLTEAADEVVVDYQPLPPAGPAADRQALVVFLRRELLAAARVMCEAAGLKLAGVTPRPFALAAAAARASAIGAVPAPDPADAPVGVLLLSERGGEFTVTRNGRVAFSRTVPAAAVASEAALLAEVRRNLGVYSGVPGGGEVEALYLAEAETGGDGWSGRLRAALPVPVHAFDPLANGTATGDVPPPLRGRFAGAVGLLAARAAGPLPVNFQQPRQPRAAASANRPRVLLGVMAAILVAGFLTVGGMLLVDQADRRVATLRAQVKQVEDEIARHDRDRKRLAAADEFTGREVVWLDELYDLAARFPDVGKMRVTTLDGAALPAPSEKDRAKEEQQLKANPQLAKTAPPRPVGKLRLTVGTDNADLPGRLVSSFKADGRYYVGTRVTGGGLVGGPGARASGAQQYVIDTQLTRRAPDGYTRRLDVPPPESPAAPADFGFGGGFNP